ncbi:MAG: hypothetical protein U9R58_09380 [Chloroflexota bacterium]|nr:hypothetical protein [Chloroflexota bacterium]
MESAFYHFLNNRDEFASIPRSGSDCAAALTYTLKLTHIHPHDPTTNVVLVDEIPEPTYGEPVSTPIRYKHYLHTIHYIYKYIH